MITALVRLSPLEVIGGPWEAPPGRIDVAGWRIDSPPIGAGNGTFKLVDVAYSGSAPTQYHTLASETLSLNGGNTLTVTRTFSAPTLASVRQKLKVRLDKDATEKWVAARGANAAAIETARTNGNSSIDGASTIAAAISAYQNVIWP